MTISHGIAWINGIWGNPKDLTICIQNQVVKLGDGIFETILVLNGQPKLLTSHLNRWDHSASLLNMAKPPDKQWLKPLIKEAIERAKLQGKNGILRLNWSRGNSSEHGIANHIKRPDHSSNNFWLELNPGEPYFNPILAMISCHEQRNANSRVSHCKHFGYSQSIQARYEANNSGYDEALLKSTTGEICCGATANLLVNRNGQWLTPRLKSGCLPGIMRQQGLEKGLFKETKLSPEPQAEDQWLLINSLSCRSIVKLNQYSLRPYTNPKSLWESLINEEI